MPYGDIDLSQTPEGLSEQQQQAITEFKKDIWKLPDGTTYEPAPVEEYLKWDWTAWLALCTFDIAVLLVLSLMTLAAVASLLPATGM